MKDSLAGSLLLLLVAGLLHGFGQDAPLGDKDDVAPVEFLLQFSDEPSLDLLVGFKLGNGDENHDGLLSAANVHLLRRRHVQLAQLLLEECKIGREGKWRKRGAKRVR